MQIEDFLSWYKTREEEEFTIEPETAYEKMCEGRNFEISHLWQRSVFLAVFLLAIAGAYGSLLKEIYFSSEPTYICVNAQNNEKATQHLIITGVCWLGITFSIQWIMMAKGSKLWYEKYEKALCDYEFGEAGIKLKLYYHHGQMPDCTDCDENIFSTKAGKFSVSRVNTTIGIVSLTAFSFLSMIHFGLFLQIKGCNSIQCALFSIALWLGAGSFLFMTLCFLCKSGDSK